MCVDGSIFLNILHCYFSFLFTESFPLHISHSMVLRNIWEYLYSSGHVTSFQWATGATTNVSTLVVQYVKHVERVA
jgi:hypothetical protein